MQQHPVRSDAALRGADPALLSHAPETAPEAARTKARAKAAASSRTTSMRLMSLMMAVLLGALLGVVAVPEQASANDYPSWSDVEKARKSESAKKAEIARIQRLLNAIQAEVQQAEQIAQVAGEAYYEAQLAFDEADLEARQLEDLANDARREADEATRRAGLLLAQLGRGGSADPTMQLLLSGGGADDLLYRLGTINQLSGQTSSIFEQAESARNTAEALLDQAEVAKEKLADLAEVAEQKFKVAQEAAEALQRKQQSYQRTQGQLQAQLAVLTENRQATEKDYKAGLEALGVHDKFTGQVSSQGWARPIVGGFISSHYGRRSPTRFHYGTDIAVSQGTTIFASAAGTVIYAGWLGNFGNHVKIRHADGTETSYSHIMNGGFLVHNGQTVQVGQPIAKVGSTGLSTGPHLHLEIRVNGSLVNPVTAFRSRGVTL